MQYIPKKLAYLSRCTNEIGSEEGFWIENLDRTCSKTTA
jgi:hypothetical protein